MKTFTISIPKPCHEDWNNMTPDAKGAFCGSCQKSVYDFSNKSDEEIISVFESKGKEKVCGRFATGQLTRPVVSFGNVNSTNRLAMFLYALLLVFGSSLFNGAEAFGQNVKGEAKMQVMGKMAMRPIKPETVVATDTTKQIKPTSCGSKIIIENEIMTLGQTVIKMDPIVKSIGDTTFTEIPMDTDIDTIAKIEDIDVIETIIETQPIEYVAGGISYTEIIQPLPPVVIDSVIDLIQDSTEDKPIVNDELIVMPSNDTSEVLSTSNNEQLFISPSVLEISVSPNPSSGQITLHYTLETMMQVRIELYDNSGKMVRILTQMSNQYAGKYNVSYNISDLQNGIYTAALFMPDRKASCKIILNK